MSTHLIGRLHVAGQDVDGQMVPLLQSDNTAQGEGLRAVDLGDGVKIQLQLRSQAVCVTGAKYNHN